MKKKNVGNTEDQKLRQEPGEVVLKEFRSQSSVA
jgi:hypothetical protein